MTGLPTARLAGRISSVDGSYVTFTAPHAAKAASSHGGDPNLRGSVGEFVLIESSGSAILARIVSVELSPREVSNHEWTQGVDTPVSPIGRATLLATLGPKGALIPGLAAMPRIGDAVFSAPGAVLAEGIRATATGIHLGSLRDHAHIPVRVTPDSMFGRHVAVVGSTGGGKSWTVARLAEQVHQAGGRLILLDATGEYQSLGPLAKHVVAGSAQATLPVYELSDADRRLLFRPAAASQLPKMTAAIISLRLAHVLGPSHPMVSNGYIVKANKSRADYQRAERANAPVVLDQHAQFDITKLPEQIGYECVWPTGKSDPTNFGDQNQQEIGYSSSLMTRISDICRTPEVLDFISPTSAIPTLLQEMDNWLATGTEGILRIDLSALPASHHLREISVNTLGERLLRAARTGSFISKPLIVALDEAHQFLGRTLGDEFAAVKPEAFDTIAKEGRKFGLTLVIATQRPGDIPSGVLSQMGCLVVHRLTERRDQDHVADASSFLDSSLAHTLPTLMPGECMVLGSGMPIPVPVRIAPPTHTPSSAGPRFSIWSPRP